MPSPNVLINGSSSVNKVDDNTLVTIQLQDLSGVTSWQLVCIGTDGYMSTTEVNSSSFLTINQSTKTATYTAPNQQSKFIFNSIVNNGLDNNNRVDPTYTTTFKVWSDIAGSTRELLAEGEIGWVDPLNRVIKNIDDRVNYTLINGTRAFTGDQSMGGHKLTNLGTPSATTDAATKAYVDATLPANMVPSTRQVIAGAGTTGGGALSGDVTINVIAGDSSLVVSADSMVVGVISDAQHGSRGNGSLHTNVNSGSAGFAPAIGGSTNKVLASSDGSTPVWTNNPTVDKITAVTEINIGTPLAVAASGNGADWGVSAQGGNVAGNGNGGFSIITGGIPGGTGSGGGVQLFSRGSDTAGGLNTYLLHEVSEISGRRVVSRLLGSKATSTQCPNGDLVEIVGRCATEPTSLPPAGNIVKYVGKTDFNIDTEVVENPYGRLYNKVYKYSLTANTSYSGIPIYKDPGFNAMIIGRIHISMASAPGSWTPSGTLASGNWSHHSDFTIVHNGATRTYEFTDKVISSTNIVRMYIDAGQNTVLDVYNASSSTAWVTLYASYAYFTI